MICGCKCKQAFYQNRFNLALSQNNYIEGILLLTIITRNVIPNS